MKLNCPTTTKWQQIKNVQFSSCIFLFLVMLVFYSCPLHIHLTLSIRDNIWWMWRWTRLCKDLFIIFVVVNVLSIYTTNEIEWREQNHWTPVYLMVWHSLALFNRINVEEITTQWWQILCIMHELARVLFGTLPIVQQFFLMVSHFSAHLLIFHVFA